MSILITGSEGFLGAQLIKILISKKKKFIGISRKKKNLLSYKFIKVDLKEIDKIKIIIKKNKIKTLIHCAWHTDPKNFYNSKINFTNLKNSFKLLKLFKNCGGKKFVGIGTCAEHYFTDNNLIKYPTKSTYGKTKNELHNLVKNSGLKYNWFRLYWLFGEGDRQGRIFTEISKNLKFNKILKINHPHHLKDYMAINDVANIIYKIIFEKKKDGTFEICSGKGISNKKIVKIFSKIVGKPLKKFASFKKLTKNKNISKIIGDNSITKTMGLLKNYNVEKKLKINIKKNYL